METSRETLGGQEAAQIEHAARAAVTGSISEMIAGLAAIALAIIGLAGVFPQILLSVAVLAFGVALIMSGGSIAARFSNVIRETSSRELQALEIGAGVTTEFAGGLAGVVLGILGLIGIVPMVLIPCAIIVYGATFIFSSGLSNRLSAIEGMPGGTELSRRFSREAVEATSGVQILVGLGAITLGILALVGLAPLVLCLVGILAIAIGGVLSSVSLTSRLWGALRLV